MIASFNVINNYGRELGGTQLCVNHRRLWLHWIKFHQFNISKVEDCKDHQLRQTGFWSQRQPCGQWCTRFWQICFRGGEARRPKYIGSRPTRTSGGHGHPLCCHYACGRVIYRPRWNHSRQHHINNHLAGEHSEPQLQGCEETSTHQYRRSIRRLFYGQQPKDRNVSSESDQPIRCKQSSLREYHSSLLALVQATLRYGAYEQRVRTTPGGHKADSQIHQTCSGRQALPSNGGWSTYKKLDVRRRLFGSNSSRCSRGKVGGSVQHRDRLRNDEHRVNKENPFNREQATAEGEQCSFLHTDSRPTVPRSTLLYRLHQDKGGNGVAMHNTIRRGADADNRVLCTRTSETEDQASTTYPRIMLSDSSKILTNLHPIHTAHDANSQYTTEISPKLRNKQVYVK